MTKTCDHRSVGVIIRNTEGKHLLLTRAKPPAGRAPVAGHVDEHGTFNQAAVAEAWEEAGLSLGELTLVDNAVMANICRRPPSHETHDGHHWIVYETLVTDTSTTFSADETRGGDWYAEAELQALADRTADYAAGRISEAEWQQDPGLEPVWVELLQVAGWISCSSEALQSAAALYSAPPT
jgi:8-oxo-dGTP pyrophosphatase MutT (NUDIX family)